MNRKLSCLLIGSLVLISVVAMAANMSVTKEHHTKVITTHYGNPNQPVKITQHHWVHHAAVGETRIVNLKHHASYGVDAQDVAVKWLNQHTHGDVLEHAAPIYNHKKEHLGLSFLHPGTYRLDFIDLKEVQKETGYKDLKKIMGDRVELIPPKGKGYYVTIKVLPSTHAAPKSLKTK